MSVTKKPFFTGSSSSSKTGSFSSSSPDSREPCPFSLDRVALLLLYWEGGSSRKPGLMTPMMITMIRTYKRLATMTGGNTP